MKNLTRRTALAAVPLLAATGVTTVASAKPDPLALSPRFVGPFAKWRACREAGNAASATAKRLEKAAMAREGIDKPATSRKAPQNADEMLDLQQKYGRDADIAAALGVGRYTVAKCRQSYRLPQVSWQTATVGKSIDDKAIAEMFAGRRFR